MANRMYMEHRITLRQLKKHLETHKYLGVRDSKTNRMVGVNCKIMLSRYRNSKLEDGQLLDIIGVRAMTVNEYISTK